MKIVQCPLLGAPVQHCVFVVYEGSHGRPILEAQLLNCHEYQRL